MYVLGVSNDGVLDSYHICVCVCAHLRIIYMHYVYMQISIYSYHIPDKYDGMYDI